jgi:predicted enzyme related to lactoylglutathione lyase
MAFYSNVFGWKFTKWDGPAESWILSNTLRRRSRYNGVLACRSSMREAVI